jgi:hypothetical protein
MKSVGVICHWSLVIGVAAALLATPARALTYSNWITNYTVSDATLAGDPDGDRIPNIIEFALAGLDPSRVDSAGGLTRMVFGVRTNTNSVIPWRDVSVITTTTNAVPPRDHFFYLGIAFTPRADVEGIRIRPQYAWWAANLGAWLDGRGVFLRPVANGTNGEVIQWMQGMFRPSAPPGSSYVRLLVEERP